MQYKVDLEVRGNVMPVFDVAVVGGGPGGYAAAIRAAQLGMKTGLIESNQLGGLCLNWGCVPSKALLRNAEVVSMIGRASEFGVNVEGLSVDLGAGVQRSRRVVSRLVKGVEFLMKKNNIDYIQLNTMDSLDKSLMQYLIKRANINK